MPDKPDIPREVIQQSRLLRTIYAGSDKPTLFTPNYGEFGPVPDKIIPLVHYFDSPHKAVCCKRGDEVFYPTASEFYYDWEDYIEDEYRWGVFAYKNKSKNPKIDEHVRIYHEQFQKILDQYGSQFTYIHIWKFQVDHLWNEYGCQFPVSLQPLITRHIQADIVISPRNRKSRPENNLMIWDQFIEAMHTHGHSVGSIGVKHYSLELAHCDVNSWDYEDNSSAVVEMLQNCKLYVGLDTGSSHLASLLSVPMIVFSHANQRYYHTELMSRRTSGYYLDLGKTIDDIEIVIDKTLEYLNGSQ